MHNNHLDYINLLKTFVKENSFYFYRSIPDYAPLFCISKNPSIYSDSYDLMNNKGLTLKNFPNVLRVAFEEETEIEFYKFLNNQPHRWTTFLSFQQFKNDKDFKYLSFMPDSDFYHFLEKLNLLSVKFILSNVRMDQQILKLLFSKVKHSSNPLVFPLFSNILIKFKSYFISHELIATLVLELKDYPQETQDQIYKSLKINNKVKASHIKNEIKEISLLSFSFNKIQLIYDLTNKIEFIKYPITERIIKKQLIIISEIFNLTFVQDKVTGSSIDFYIQILKKSQEPINDSQKQFLNTFILKAIAALITRQFESDFNENITDEFQEQQINYVKKLKDTMDLSEKLPLKNHSIKLLKI